MLPAAGAAVPIHNAGRTLGFLVITPQHGHTAVDGAAFGRPRPGRATVTSAITVALGLAEPVAAANGTTTGGTR